MNSRLVRRLNALVDHPRSTAHNNALAKYGAGLWYFSISQYCKFGFGLDRLRLDRIVSLSFTFQVIISAGQTGNEFPVLRQCRPLADILKYSFSSMQKFITYLLLILSLAGGVLLIYRSLLSANRLIPIKGKVLEKKIEIVSTRKGSSRYALIFKVDSLSDKLGIYMGTNTQAANNQTGQLIDTHQIYTFLIDPTISTEDGINLGIREIIVNGQTIYKESQKFNMIFGIFLILLGVIGIFLLSKIKRTKNVS